MNLVQKLPVAMGLACVMMMSSCSKEDVQTPTPQMEVVNESSNLRGGLTANPDLPPGGLYLSPVFPSTIGQVGIDVYPMYWERIVDSPYDNAGILPTGTSNLTHLWGNPIIPWKTALQPIPGVSNPGSMVTVTSKGSTSSSISCAKTKIVNLKPDKQYEITFYMSTTIPNVNPGSLNLKYAKGVTVSLYHGNNSQYCYFFEGKNAEWIVRKCIFKPAYGTTEAIFKFNAITSNDGEYAYANIFVDKNSIKEVN